jgi:hypothetical protein
MIENCRGMPDAINTSKLRIRNETGFTTWIALYDATSALCWAAADCSWLTTSHLSALAGDTRMLCIFAADGAGAVHVAVTQWRSGARRADKLDVLSCIPCAIPARRLE